LLKVMKIPTQKGRSLMKMYGVVPNAKMELLHVVVHISTRTTCTLERFDDFRTGYVYQYVIHRNT